MGNESLGDLSLHCILDVRATAVLFFLHVLHEICVCITKQSSDDATRADSRLRDGAIEL